MEQAWCDDTEVTERKSRTDSVLLQRNALKAYLRYRLTRAALRLYYQYASNAHPSSSHRTCDDIFRLLVPINTCNHTEENQSVWRRDSPLSPRFKSVAEGVAERTPCESHHSMTKRLHLPHSENY